MIKPTKLAEIERKWHIFDAKDQVLGRLATKITPLLIGKNKSYFVSHLDCGDHVVIINASMIKVTGKKETEKKYTRYSGYPGGLKVQTVADLRKKYPERIIEKAILNMLPKNKLRREWLKKLHVFSGEKHDYGEKFNNKK